MWILINNSFHIIIINLIIHLGKWQTFRKGPTLLVDVSERPITLGTIKGLKVAWSATVSCSDLLENDIKCVY